MAGYEYLGSALYQRTVRQLNIFCKGKPLWLFFL